MLTLMAQGNWGGPIPCGAEDDALITAEVQIILTVLIETRMRTLFMPDTRSILLACYGPSAL